jgi:hypothetical protein
MAINIKTDTKNLKKTDFSTVKNFGKNNKVYIALQSVNLGVNIGKKRVFFSYFSHFFESIHGKIEFGFGRFDDKKRTKKKIFFGMYMESLHRNEGEDIVGYSIKKVRVKSDLLVFNRIYMY